MRAWTPAGVNRLRWSTDAARFTDSRSRHRTCRCGLRLQMPTRLPRRRRAVDRRPVCHVDSRVAVDRRSPPTSSIRWRAVPVRSSAWIGRANGRSTWNVQRRAHTSSCTRADRTYSPDVRSARQSGDGMQSQNRPLGNAVDGAGLAAAVHDLRCRRDPMPNECRSMPNSRRHRVRARRRPPPAPNGIPRQFGSRWRSLGRNRCQTSTADDVRPLRGRSHRVLEATLRRVAPERGLMAGEPRGFGPVALTSSPGEPRHGRSSFTGPQPVPDADRLATTLGIDRGWALWKALRVPVDEATGGERPCPPVRLASGTSRSARGVYGAPLMSTPPTLWVLRGASQSYRTPNAAVSCVWPVIASQRAMSSGVSAGRSWS